MDEEPTGGGGRGANVPVEVTRDCSPGLGRSQRLLQDGGQAHLRCRHTSIIYAVQVDSTRLGRHQPLRELSEHKDMQGKVGLPDTMATAMLALPGRCMRHLHGTVEADCILVVAFRHATRRWQLQYPRQDAHGSACGAVGKRSGRKIIVCD